MEILFDGRRILVTGASTGIGAALATGYAAAGSVVVHDNSSADSAEALVAPAAPSSSAKAFPPPRLRHSPRRCSTGRGSSTCSSSDAGGLVERRPTGRLSRDLATMVASVPLGGAGTSEQCVRPALFVTHDGLSRYVTGQVLLVNGGQHFLV